MRRTDFKLTRFHLAIQAIKVFIEKKHEIDPNDSIGIITYGDSSKVIGRLTKNVKFILQKLTSDKLNKDIVFSGTHRGLDIALKDAKDILSEKIRTIGGQIYRILIISDWYKFKLTDRMLEFIKIASGLKIYIDICIFHKISNSINRSELLLMTKTTGGEFGHFYSKKALLRGITGFASKKINEDINLGLLSSMENREEKYLTGIALTLQIPTLKMVKKYHNSEITDLTDYLSKILCQICFDNKCAINSLLFVQSGRFCPYCMTPFHLHCAGMWAISAEVAPNLYRCPYCYTLLQISPIILKGLKLKRKDLLNPPVEPRIIKMLKIKPEDVRQEKFSPVESCYYCNLDINQKKGSVKEQNSAKPKQKLFKCSECSALYHEKCLESMYKKYKCCKNCEGKIV
jgi:von Willebrand factor type A domain